MSPVGEKTTLLIMPCQCGMMNDVTELGCLAL